VWACDWDCWLDISIATSSTQSHEEAPWEETTLRKNKPMKDVPSALNAVVVPSMTLPKEVHDKYNKWGKDGYPWGFGEKVW
jgi:hypothetical protein